MVKPELIEALADNIELKIQGGFSPRPILSVPHIVSDEASCYYQGYTVSSDTAHSLVDDYGSCLIHNFLLFASQLAEMSVHQTRDFFKERDGFIVDNPKIGPCLTEAYWQWGNSRPFLEIVKELTGKELSGDAWINALEESIEDKIAREKKEYDAAIQEKAAEGCDDIDLDMVVRFVDGDTLISDSSEVGLLGACKDFENFVAARVAESAAS